MIDYKKIKKECLQNSSISRNVIDDFLIYYAANEGQFQHEVKQRLYKYKHIVSSQDASWERSLMSQYITHRIFKKDGLIKKYLKHSALKDLTPKERKFLEDQSNTPWRFCFSEIISNPEPDFYEMKDIFSDEPFLLYSPGVNSILKESNRLLWFNLIAFNGFCWQTYGPITPYKSFEIDDIFFYGTELNSQIEDEDDLINDIDNNPVPYMMLLWGSEFPVIYNKGHQMVISQGEFEAMSFDTNKKLKKFTVKTVNNIYLYSLKRWDTFPHFARFFYDSNKQIILLKSMTDKGYSKLVEEMTSEGINVSDEPDIRLNLTMKRTAEDIFKKEINLNPYETIFEEEPSEVDQSKFDKLYDLSNMLIPDINNGITPNYQKLAEESGLDVKFIKGIADKLAEKVKGKFGGE